MTSSNESKLIGIYAGTYMESIDNLARAPNAASYLPRALGGVFATAKKRDEWSGPAHLIDGQLISNSYRTNTANPH